MSKRTLLHALHVIMLSNQPQQAIGFASWLKCQREMEEDEASHQRFADFDWAYLYCMLGLILILLLTHPLTHRS